MRDEYEPLFLAARVNIVMVGHVHAYQRTKMVASSGLVVDDASGQGIVHWMVGMTGKSLYQKWRTEAFSEPQPLDAPPNDWVAYKDATFWGFSSIEVPNATHACLRAFCTERFPADAPGACDPDVPVDEYWLVNQLVANPLPTTMPSPTVSASASATPTISLSPTASLSFGASPSNTPSASPTLSVSSSPTSSAGAAAANALNLERDAEAGLSSKALGTGVGVGLLVAAVVASLAVYVASLRRRMVREKISGGGPPAVVTEFGVRRGNVNA